LVGRGAGGGKGRAPSPDRVAAATARQGGRAGKAGTGPQAVERPVPLPAAPARKPARRPRVP